MNIAIIGSGVAGLTAGAALANAGHRVTIFEQAGYPGGATAGVQREGYRWDLGQLIIEGLGEDEPLGMLLAKLGVAGKIEIRKEDRGYVFPDFEIRKPAEYAGLRWRIEKLQALFPEDAQGLARYWRDYVRFTALMTSARRLEGAAGVKRLTSQARLYLQLLPFLPKMKWSAEKLMNSYFQSKRLQAVFIAILADFFTPPSRFPGLGVFALNPEPVYEKRMPKALAKGAEQLYHYDILGGIRSLVDALAGQVVSRGGEIRLNCPVSQVVVKDGAAQGVIVQGETIPADVVIASGGAKETFLGLVGEEHLTEDFIARVNNQPLMDSVFMVHLGVDFDPSPHLHGPVTYFYGTYDLEEGLREALEGVYHGGEKGFVVHVPSLHSPEMAPPGCQAMTIYTVCPDRLAEGSWSERKEEYTDQLIDCAERRIPGLRQHIRIIEVLTPEDWRQRTHLQHHAFGGVAPIQDTPRVPHQTPVAGLWFIGAQSESGGGVNNVMPAAYKVANKLTKA
jgi:phytoene dehydrogenase-like protein